MMVGVPEAEAVVDKGAVNAYTYATYAHALYMSPNPKTIRQCKTNT